MLVGLVGRRVQSPDAGGGRGRNRGVEALVRECEQEEAEAFVGREGEKAPPVPPLWGDETLGVEGAAQEWEQSP